MGLEKELFLFPAAGVTSSCCSSTTVVKGTCCHKVTGSTRVSEQGTTRETLTGSQLLKPCLSLSQRPKKSGNRPCEWFKQWSVIEGPTGIVFLENTSSVKNRRVYLCRLSWDLQESFASKRSQQAEARRLVRLASSPAG